MPFQQLARSKPLVIQRFSPLVESGKCAILDHVMEKKTVDSAATQNILSALQLMLQGTRTTIRTYYGSQSIFSFNYNGSLAR